jgi:hypothetical protein
MFHQISPMESSLPRYPVVLTNLFAGERLNRRPDSDNLGNQFPASIWVRLSPRNAAAVIIFSQSSEIPFFQETLQASQSPSWTL